MTVQIPTLNRAELGWAQLLLLVGALGAAINAGVFFAFSVMIMPGLDRVAGADPRGAVAAMQAINVVAVRPPLMIVIFGTTLVALAAGVLGVVRLPTVGGWLTVAGAAVFVLGAAIMTIAFHVPLNDALAAVGPGDDPAAAWAAFSPSWTAGNHVRTATGAVAAVLLLAGAWR